MDEAYLKWALQVLERQKKITGKVQQLLPVARFSD